MCRNSYTFENTNSTIYFARAYIFPPPPDIEFKLLLYLCVSVWNIFTYPYYHRRPHEYVVSFYYYFFLLLFLFSLFFFFIYFHFASLCYTHNTCILHIFYISACPHRHSTALHIAHIFYFIIIMLCIAKIYFLFGRDHGAIWIGCGVFDDWYFVVVSYELNSMAYRFFFSFSIAICETHTFIKQNIRKDEEKRRRNTERRFNRCCH